MGNKRTKSLVLARGHNPALGGGRAPDLVEVVVAGGVDKHLELSAAVGCLLDEARVAVLNHLSCRSEVNLVGISSYDIRQQKQGALAAYTEGKDVLRRMNSLRWYILVAMELSSVGKVPPVT